MILRNHHAHSTFSDGRAPAETFLRTAIGLGMEAYGFSDHAPIPIHDFGNMEMSNLTAYSAEIKRLRGAYGDKIEIYKSLEVDYIPNVLSVDSEDIRAAGLDYTVGAVHFVEELDGKPWSFQRANPSFERGIKENFGGDARAMVERYFELVREMVTLHPPDVVAHLDRIKKRNPTGKYWDEHAPWFRRQIEETLGVIATAGIILEVNTRGIYKGEIDATYPSTWIVELAHERGIPLQVNSDAHELEHIMGGFEVTYGSLKKIGVEAVRVFRAGAWVEVGID